MFKFLGSVAFRRQSGLVGLFFGNGRAKIDCFNVVLASELDENVADCVPFWLVLLSVGLDGTGESILSTAGVLNVAVVLVEVKPGTGVEYPVELPEMEFDGVKDVAHRAGSRRI